MPDRFARRQLDDQEIWLDFQGGRFYGLNATATVILDAWQQGVRAPDALADRLIERFQVSRADACLAVESFLRETAKHGLTDA